MTVKNAKLENFKIIPFFILHCHFDFLIFNLVFRYAKHANFPRYYKNPKTLN